MHVLITGGAGFLGKALAARLLQRGQLSAATAATNRSTRSRSPTSSGPKGCDDPRIAQVIGDIADRALLERVIDAGHHRHLPPRGRRQRPGGGGLRPRHAREPRRHARAARGLPRGGPPAAPGVRQLGRGLRRRAARGRARSRRRSRRRRRTAPRRRSASCSSPTTRGEASSTAARCGCRRSPSGPASPTPRRRRSRAASSASRSTAKSPICPVERSTRMWVISPASAVGGLIHAHDLPAERLGSNRSISLPGLSVTVGEMADALGAGRGRRGRRADPLAAGSAHHETDRHLAGHARREPGPRRWDFPTTRTSTRSSAPTSRAGRPRRIGGLACRHHVWARSIAAIVLLASLRAGAQAPTDRRVRPTSRSCR